MCFHSPLDQKDNKKGSYCADEQVLVGYIFASAFRQGLIMNFVYFSQEKTVFMLVY